MLFADGKSPLVRLSDSLKFGLAACGDTCHSLLALYHEHKESFEKLRRLARDVANEEALRTAAGEIPEEISWRGAQLQYQLHSQVLSVLLTCCFSLEAYANTLAYFLFAEADYLHLLAAGRSASSEALTASFEDMTIRDKWRRLAALGPAGGFDEARDPYQSFNILFRFRDDCVHGKVRDFTENFGSRRYGGKLPDPVTGMLTLTHALFGADTFWTMVLQIHELLDLDIKTFHRHYNLTPWNDEAARKELVNLATRYRDVVG